MPPYQSTDSLWWRRRFRRKHERCKTVVFWGFCPWQGRRQKPIDCPTLAKNRRGAQRNEDLVVQAVSSALLGPHRPPSISGPPVVAALARLPELPPDRSPG